MERCTAWAVVGEDQSKLQHYRGRTFHPRGVIGYLAMDCNGNPVMFSPGGILPWAAVELKPAAILTRIEGLLMRPLFPDRRDQYDDAAGGARYVGGQLVRLDRATFAAEREAYFGSDWKSVAARMPEARSPLPGDGFCAAEIKSGHRKPLQRTLQLAGMVDAKDYSTTAAA